MNIEQYRDFCLALPYVTDELPFDEDVLVFKVAGKIFTLTSLAYFETITLKCTPEESLELQSSYDGVTPGYHMNKKHWITVQIAAVPDELLYQWTRQSYALVVKKLPKKISANLAINLY